MAEDVDNKPPLAACEVLANGLELKAKIKQTWEDIKDIVDKALGVLAMILWGTINLADILGAEFVSAIGEASSAAAKSVLGAVSSVASSILEAIFSRILAILLAFPDAIFSLVAIPLDFATESGEREKYFLTKANNEMSKILLVINKWTKGLDGTRFYDQMKDALPYLRVAEAEAISMQSELSAENAVFDDSKYRSLLDNLGKAIKETTPEPTLIKRLNNARIATSKYDDEKKAALNALNQKYKDLRKDIDDLRESAILSISPSDSDAEDIISQDSIDSYEKYGGDPEFISQFLKNAKKKIIPPENMADAISLSKVDLVWGKRIAELDSNKKIEEAGIEARFELLKITDNSKWANIYEGVEGEFKHDMNVLSTSIVDFLQYIKKAFIQYNLCQLSTITVYNIRSRIRALIEIMISFLRKAENLPAATIISSLEVAYLGMAVVDDWFVEEIDKFEESNHDKKTSSAKMATVVASCNLLLQSSDAVLRGTITKSMIALINSDDLLESENEKFDEFIGRIYDITDRGGTTGIWGVDATESTFKVNYVQLIADAASMVTKVPLLSLSFSKKNKEESERLIKKARDSLTVLSRHNKEVMGVLYSYTPYQCAECGEITKLLNESGLLAAFATSLSIGVLVDSIKSLYGFASDVFPSYDNCNKAYPGLFDSPEQGAAAAQDEQDTTSPELLSDSGKNNEKMEKKVLIANSVEKKASYITISDQEDAKGYAEDTDTN